MKTITFILLLAVCALSAYSQNITNTLGTGGAFMIKGASNSYLTLNQTDGLFSLNKNLSLLNSTDSTIGYILKQWRISAYVHYERYIHNFAPVGAYGYNTFVGLNSGNFTMSGTSSSSSYNTGIGFQSLQSLTTGSDNTAVGYQSLISNTTGIDNTAVGYQSLISNTNGSNNTAVGYSSLWSSPSGMQNTALGDESLLSNTTGSNNTAVGDKSLSADIWTATGSDNTALGRRSSYDNTSGSYNTAMGENSLFYNMTGSYNTAVGENSLHCVSANSGAYGNSCSYNTAVGDNSLSSNWTGYSNTAMGDYSLCNDSIGYYNTAAGAGSLYSNKTGYSNTAVGMNSLYSTNSPENTALGNYAGLNVTTGINNTLIGYDAQPIAGAVSNTITLGNTSVMVLRCNAPIISALSDARDKRNIQDLSLGIDFLMKLKPRLFNWDRREWYKDSKSNGSKMQKTPTAGFIAQELDEAQTKENAEWLNLVLKDNPEKLEATPGNLLPVMVKALRELKAENYKLKDKLDKYEQMQNVLVKEIEQLQ